MRQKNNLPVIGITDICTPLKAEVFSLFRHEQQGKASLPQAHKHNFFMLLVVEKGGGTHTIDFTTYKVTPRSVCFLAPGQAHSWELHPRTTGFQLMFGPEFLSDGPQQWPFFSFSASPFLQLSAPQFETVMQELENIEKEYALADWLSVRIITHRLKTLLALLERYYDVKHPSDNQVPLRRMVKQFLELLEKHYRENATVEFYADKLHVTPQYLNIVCKKETGITAGSCIRQRVLLEAKRLLTLTGQDVKEIAFELGFSDTSYFSRFFRRYTGETPVAFRQHIQKVPGSAQ
ncbi:AraC family transcriptional regulator [Chitinophaga barathri]|uniref:AraC family transcriptional regulator n=1 Tax=Chitinophaga barathri TaxID=1647451 RepID=A0A3N4M5S7_9BACT|nr:AraC family transcriptional regulator [Chitinophaga barathri]RPD38622.1 AraC family transcriptional regulator [Chitinophaga barathri]